LTLVATHLFVYGTLKRGGRNHNLLAGQRFLGEVRTATRYRLYDRGPHPCLVEDPDHGRAIHGELWEVTPQVVELLDEFEEIPYPFDRRPVALAPPDAAAFTYLYQGDVSTLPDCGAAWPPETPPTDR
jgi:gamma-glutamylaminecyclotransferase